TWRMAAPDTVYTFNGMFVADPLANALKMITYLVMAVVFLYSRDYLRERGLFKGEFFVLGLLGMLGMMIMISSHHFVTVYLGLELLSLTMSAMIAFNRDSGTASEAAMKFFVLSAISSGILLYGMSILYGITGSLDISTVSTYVSNAEVSNVGLILGLAFVLVGISFKLGVVPFHMWIPDVYEGAPTAVTLFVGTGPKLAAFALFMRMLADALGGMHADWQGMLVVLSILSMGLGSVLAIAQTNIKRMLGYSTITHVGFILLGILSGTNGGYQAAMFYTITYVLMAAAGFGMVILLSRKGFEAERIEDFKGLNDRNRWFAGMMLFVMFGMAGVPPFVGFWAKWVVLRAVLNTGLVWLAGLAVFFAIISAFYYLRVVRCMYFDKPAEDAGPLVAGPEMQMALSLNGLLILFLGLFPGTLMAICQHAIQF
ncbi:MAG: NADH-quinone oxidoreductase subunit NuoN, partial [Gammaproteobacteria bacterium]